MSLAEGLTSALSTFTTIRDENRRSQLHDLKVERYGLMNEGSRLSNKGERLNNRAREVKATVAEYLMPHTIRTGVAEADKAEFDRDKAEESVRTQRASTYSTTQRGHANAGLARKYGSQARVAEATEAGEIAGTNAENEGKVLKVDRDRVADVQEGIGRAWIASGENLEGASQNDLFMGSVEALAELSFGVDVAETRYDPQSGGMVFKTADGEEYAFSEDETMAFISDTENVASHVEGQAQRRFAEEQVAQGVNSDFAALEAERGERTVAAQGNAERFQRGQTLADLEGQLAEAERVLNEEIRGQGGSAYHKRLAAEKEDEIAALESNIEAMRGSGVEVIDEDDYVSAQREQLGGLASLGARADRSVAEGRASLNRFDMSQRAGVEDPLTNMRTTGRADVSAQDEVDEVERATKLGAPARDLVKRVSGTAGKYESSFEKGSPARTTAARATAQVQGFLADNPKLADEAARDPASQRFLEAMATDAVLLAMDTGESAGFYMNDAMKYENPESQAAARMVYESKVFDSDATPEERMGRFRAAQKAAQLVEDGRMNKEDAYDAAIQTIGDSTSSGPYQPRTLSGLKSM